MAQVLTIKIPRVEMEMLEEIQKRKHEYRDFENLILKKIREEFSKLRK
jgi:hypothetical protein